MKKLNIAYWIVTIIFAALIVFSSIPDIMVNQQAIEIVSTQLHYPQYIIFFLGIAKLLGVIAILIPGFPRLKEWAYAGIFFDLAGATYSGICAAGHFDPMMLGMLAFYIPLFASYILYHKRLAAMNMNRP